MTNEEILKLWFEAGIISSPDTWPFTPANAELLALQTREAQEKLLADAGPALM
jgi:hypothetical protein